MSIFDPMTKALVNLARMALVQQLEKLAKKHAANHKAVDALNAATAAINGAVDQLMLIER